MRKNTMSSINLQGLIDEVLSMVKSSGNRNDPNYWSRPSWDQLREEEYWKEMRRRNTELELKGAEGKNRLAEIDLTNSGNLEKQKLVNAGELARQSLMNEATRYTADQGLQGHMYTADTNYAMKRDELNKGYDPELIKAHAAVIANVNSTPEAVAASQAAIDWYTKDAIKKRQQLNTASAEAPKASPAAPMTAEPDKDIGGVIGKFLGESPSAGPTRSDMDAFRKSSAPGPSIFSPNDQPWMRPLDGINSAPSAPPSPAATTPAPSGVGGWLGKTLYGATHPFETTQKPVPFTRATSPAREAIDKGVFETFPNAVSNATQSAIEGTKEFGENVGYGWNARKEEEAKKKKKRDGLI